MKTFAMTTAAALFAVATAASAQNAAPGDLQLSSGAIEQLMELKPDLDIGSLSAIQINEVNRKVDDGGLTDGELITILETM
ncbi:hypothetical protein [Falsirhodobacter sp. alg1]|uniref:hypothetical protein n=1 Tax=Falsirhodobacter sp. alg1 TaxID=1472418 RepID=UPI0005EE1D2F|nr:hypothetical protein [Falsirhodobacter sp. alg1]